MKLLIETEHLSLVAGPETNAMVRIDPVHERVVKWWNGAGTTA